MNNLTRRSFLSSLAAAPLAVKAFVMPSPATVAEFQNLIGPLIIGGIDITSTVRQQFENGAIAVKIYCSGSTPFIRIDRDGTITRLKGE